MAKIEGLPDIEWNAYAALHNALERMGINDPMITLWMDKDGVLHHTTNGTRMEIIYMLEREKKEILEG